LERFLKDRDEVAFELIVRRHGPLVLGVCQRVLSQSHDVEDVFQATFLMLVRKADAIAKQQSLGSWLYKVAFRLALRIRQRSAQELEQKQVLAAAAGAAVQPDNSASVDWKDLRPILDEEINRLPEKFRSVFVLSCLEGRNQQEVANMVGCPKGTVHSRLARARKRLQEALQKRGLGISVPALVDMVADNSPTLTAIAPVLVATTIYSAVLLKIHGLTQASLSPSVLELLHGSKQGTVFAGKSSTVIGIILFSLLLGAGAFYSLTNRSFSSPPAPFTSSNSPAPSSTPAASSAAPCGGCCSK
jgi:RNA polymerase sigma factor (sigma-70 family)